MASFFVRAAAGQYDLNQPLATAAAADQHGPQQGGPGRPPSAGQRRDNRRVGGLGVEEVDPVGNVGTPSRVVEAKELLNLVRDKLQDDERRLADIRVAGP